MNQPLEEDIKGLVISIMAAGDAQRKDLIPDFTTSLMNIILAEKRQLLEELIKIVMDEADDAQSFEDKKFGTRVSGWLLNAYIKIDIDEVAKEYEAGE